MRALTYVLSMLWMICMPWTHAVEKRVYMHNPNYTKKNDTPRNFPRKEIPFFRDEGVYPIIVHQTAQPTESNNPKFTSFSWCHWDPNGQSTRHDTNGTFETSFTCPRFNACDIAQENQNESMCTKLDVSKKHTQRTHNTNRKTPQKKNRITKQSNRNVSTQDDYSNTSHRQALPSISYVLQQAGLHRSSGNSNADDTSVEHIPGITYVFLQTALFPHHQRHT